MPGRPAGARPRTMLRLATLLFALAAPLRAADVDYVQTGWDAGAASGSTTSATSGWRAFDSQDGNLVTLSTAVRSLTGVPHTLTLTDDGTGESGFSAAGALFSSTTVLGSSAAAHVGLALGESVALRSATMPQARDQMAAVYHPGARRVYLFGGRRADGLLTNDVLEFDPATGVLTGAADVLPTARAGVSAAYDPVSNKIFVFGGFDNSGFEQAQIIKYDPIGHSVTSALSNLPTARSQTSAAYDPATARIYVFGGRQFGAGTHLDAIVEFNPANEGTTAVSTTLPSGRVESAAVYDPASGDILLFGGNATGTWLSDVVAFHPAGSSTTLLSPMPSPRAGASAVRHPLTGRIYVYGGENAGAATAEILEHDPGPRTTLPRPAALPSARTRAAAAASTHDLRFFVFGGTAAAAGFNETLEHVMVASGVYRSPAIDTGNLSQLGTLSWTPSVQADTSVAVGFSFRAGNVATPGPTWSNGGAFGGTTNGGSLAAFGTSRYVQFTATFTTTNLSTTAVVSDVTVTFGQTAPSGTLVSTAFDSGFPGNVLRRLRYSGSFNSGTTAQFQLRTAPDNGSGQPGAWTSWLGPTASTDAYVDPNGGVPINPLHADGSGDRFFQYRAVLLSSSTLLPAVLTTVTVTTNHLPGPPTFDTFVALSSAEIQATFTDGSDNETDFVLSTGTLPSPTNLGVSTGTGNGPGTGAQQSAVVRGLLPNVAYFARVRARNTPDAVLSAYSNELNIFTLANVPTSLSVSSVSLTSATLDWGAAGNPNNTPYEVSLSTDGFSTHFSTPVAFADGLTAVTTTLFTLAPGTTYSFRVRAQNGNAFATAFSVAATTATRPQALTNLSGAALGVSSVAWTWDSSGPAARYRVTSASAGVLFADLAASSFVYVGAATNSVVGIRVQPYTGTAFGPLSAASTFFTLAADPAGFSAVSQGTGSVSLSWGAAGNPSTTRYDVTLSTVGFPLAVSTPVALAANYLSTTAAFGGLAAGTTHFWRVRAFNGDSLPTDFASASTQTLPGTPTAPVPTALGVSSINWSWTNTAGPAVTSYILSRASDGVVVTTVSAVSFAETALSSDTAYGLRVRAVGGAGPGALTAAATVFTLAAPPSLTAVSAVFVDSVTIAWDPSGNPARTVYQVERATPSGAFAAAGSSTGTAFTLNNLLADTTHTFRVRAVNGDGVLTAYDVPASTFVRGRLPIPVSAFRAFPAGSARVLLSWTVSPTTTVARYDVFYDSATGSVDYSTPLASVASPTSFYLTLPLTANATYLFGLRAVDERGASEKNFDVLASALAVSTAPPLSAFVRSPAGGTRVWGDRLTLTAGLAAGTAAELSQVRFQFRASTSAAWSDVAAAEAERPNPAVRAPFAVFWDVTALATGRYQLRAVARGLDGSDDPAPPAAFLNLNPTDPDREEVRLGAGRVRTRLKVYRTSPALLEAASPSTAFTTRVSLATGCVAADQDMLRFDGAPAAVPTVPSSFSASGIVFEVTLESGQSALSGGLCARFELAQLDRDGNRRVDGTETRSDNLVLAHYDAAAGRWKADAPGRVTSDDGGTLVADSSHFTLFAALSPAALDLSAVRVYPVPWRPNNADPDDGKPYSAGDATSGIIFDSLPPDATLSVYTVAGSLVWESPGPAQGGLRRWDARNGDGRDVASGVYFLVVTAPGGATRVEKLAVVR
ncbi:hypothetical protein EPO15_04470 [bacterium]|nr:MAG: hypothetical protein EPO15_04470 [bacterium]